MWWDDDGPLEEGYIRRLGIREMLGRIADRLRPESRRLLLGVLLLLVSVAAELAGPLVLRHLIDKAIPQVQDGANPTAILTTALVYLVVFLTGSSATFLQVIVVARVGLRTIARLKQNLFDHLLSLGMDHFDRHPSGRLMTRVESDTERLQSLFSEVTLSLLRTVVLLIGTFTVMLQTDVGITLAVFALTLPFVVGALFFLRAMRPLYQRVRRVYANLSTFISEYVQAVPILQAYGRTSWAMDRLRRRNRERYRAEITTEFLDYTFWGVVGTVEVLAVMLILYLGFGDRFGGALTLGTAVLFVEYTRRLFWPLAQFTEQLGFIQKAFASADRVFGVLDTESRVTNRPGARTEIPTAWREIRFENVRFSYDQRPVAALGDDDLDQIETSVPSGVTGNGGNPHQGGASPSLAARGAASEARGDIADSPAREDAAASPARGDAAAWPTPSNVAASPASGDKADSSTRSDAAASPALDDVSFSLKRGDRIALVGPSGGGKTTIVGLLLRFYEPDSGRITLDGTDIREYTLDAWRRLLGLVLQDIHLFPGTVAENLEVFLGETPRQQLEDAVRALGAGEVLTRLPRGLDTELSEGGQNLSMGERQIVCFARAMVRKPDVLVLDEATSSVDPATEKRIQTSLERLMEGRTSLVVAHRLSTITTADRILVLERGRIVQEGRHADLLREGGLYRALYELQFAAGEVA